MTLEGKRDDPLIPSSLILSLMEEIYSLPLGKKRAGQELDPAVPTLIGHARQFEIPFSEANVNGKKLAPLCIKAHIDFWEEKGYLVPNIELCGGPKHRPMVTRAMTDAVAVGEASHVVPFPASPARSTRATPRLQKPVEHSSFQTINSCLSQTEDTKEMGTQVLLRDLALLRSYADPAHSTRHTTDLLTPAKNTSCTDGPDSIEFSLR
jgi:hypothetical protein